MKKRRLEIIALAALIVFAGVDRPTLTTASIDLQPAMIQVADLAPQRVETVGDLGVIVAKLVISWID